MSTPAHAILAELEAAGWVGLTRQRLSDVTGLPLPVVDYWVIDVLSLDDRIELGDRWDLVDGRSVWPWRLTEIERAACETPLKCMNRHGSGS